MTRARASAGRDQSGFSMIDMVVAASISLLVLTWSLVSFRVVFPRWRLERAANDVAASLKAARASAILDGEERTVDFDIERGRFTPVLAPIGEKVVLERERDADEDDEETVQRVAALHQDIAFARPEEERPKPPRRGSKPTEPTEPTEPTPTPTVLDKPITFRRPGTPDGDHAAAFSPRGVLLSSQSPAFVYLGDIDDGLYRRVRVSILGTVTVEEWTGSEWR